MAMMVITNFNAIIEHVVIIIISFTIIVEFIVIILIMVIIPNLIIIHSNYYYRFGFNIWTYCICLSQKRYEKKNR